MNIVKFLFQRVVLLAVVVCGMVACNPSDPVPGVSGVPSGGSTLSGTAATGAAIFPATIAIKGANGLTVVAATNADGNYIGDVSTLTPPYLLRVPDPAIANSYLYSVATAAGTANIHPFTDLIIRNWYKVKVSDVETEFNGTLIAGNQPTVAGINTIEAVIRNILASSLSAVGVPAGFNLLTSTFTANNTGFDLVLDNTGVVIAPVTGGVSVIATDPVGGRTSTLATTTISTNLAPAIPVVDDVAPTDPSGLAALPAGTTSIVLFWNASTDLVGVAGYNIYRGATTSTISTTKIASSPFPGFSDTGLTSNTPFCYQVEAFDRVGNSSAKSAPPVCATTPTLTTADTTPPAAPTSLVATAITQGQIDLAWTASISPDVIAYDIYRGEVLITTTAGVSYSDTGRAANTLYSYTVRARDAAGNASVASTAASATTAAGIPSAPVGVVAVAGNAQVTISWSPVSGATSYKMYMDNVSGISKTTTTPGVMHHPSVSSPFVHTALTNGITYFFVVTAVNASGESIESAEVQAMPATAPAANASQFNGTYDGSLTGTQTTGTNAGASVSAPLTLVATNGVVTGGVVTGGPISGSVSSSGVITFTVPKNSDSLGAPCDDMTFTGVVIVSASGGAVMTGTWSTPAGAPDPIGTTCPGFSGTWAVNRVNFDGTYAGSWSKTCLACGITASAGTFTATLVNGMFSDTQFTLTSGDSGILFSSGTVSSSGVIAGTGATPSQCSSASTFTGQVTTTLTGGAIMNMTYSRPASGTPGTPNRCEAESGIITATTTPLNLTITHQGPNTGATGITPLGYVCNSSTTTLCVFSIPSGTVLNLSANVPATSTPGIFSNGTGSAAGCVTSTCSFTMTTDSAVTTTFNQNLGPFPALTITLTGTGTGVLRAGNNTCQNSNILESSACSTAWVSGSVVTLRAEEPPVGTTFGGFSGACVSSTTICTFTITNNSSVTATFN